MDNQTLPGTGYIYKPVKPEDRTILAFEATPPVYDWSSALVEDGEPSAQEFDVMDEDQDGSGSCTVQAGSYGFNKTTGIEINREDIYAHVHLPGGGAYLDAFIYYLNQNGYLDRAKYPDPALETEADMEKIVQVTDPNDRIRTFLIKGFVSTVVSIDAAAQAIANHDYICLGIAGNWVKGWEKSWTDPYFFSNAWQHSTFSTKGGAVIRNGKKAIKVKSSWTKHIDPAGKPSYAHYFNEDYFNNGGVFEILGVDVKEITNVSDNQKFIIQFGSELGVFEFTPEGEIVGKFAKNAAEFHQQGLDFGIHTCDVDANGNGSNFAQPNFTKTA